MRVIVMIKATSDSENGQMPNEKLLTEMGNFNEELVKAGIMLSGEGLHPSRRGKRVHFSKGKTSVVDGPFTETRELLAGFWIWKVKSMDEAVEWVKRVPSGGVDYDYDIEIRPVHEAEDFGAEYTPEVRAQEDRIRTELEKQQKKG